MIYAIVEIFNIVINVKVRNIYSKYQNLIKDQNDLLIQDIHYLKTLLGIAIDKAESNNKVGE